MCGIAGFLDLGRARPVEELDEIAMRMAQALAHRGPDDCAVFSEPEAGISLAHRRLSIIDLSPAGRQPMVSADGRYVLVFNGEIYNHHQLRAALDERFEVSWRGHSDTETLLAYVALLGVREAIEAANGMFALALWDRRDRRLYLARDRLGEKPLYFGRLGSTLMFGSELKALEAHPEWQQDLDVDSVHAYLRYGYIPAPHTIWRSIRKLEAGSIGVFDLARQHEGVKTERYWAIPLPRADAGSGSEELITRLDSEVQRAVGLRMEADVPLGCFLSGGVDSSLIAAAMQTQSDRPVRTFSIGFDSPEHNEAEHAKAVANHLGTDHTELYVDGSMALSVVPDLPRIYDEPFADSSQIPTLLLSHLTRKHVTVALSGDGGDELFGGYDRYTWLGHLERGFRVSPKIMRKLAADAAHLVPIPLIRGGLQVLMRGSRTAVNEGRVRRMAYMFRQSDAYRGYRGMISLCQEPGQLVRGGSERETVYDRVGQGRGIEALQAWAAYADAAMYMPDDILVKVDRASMDASLEVRVPFLDPSIVEFASTIGWEHKLRSGVGKWVLRQVLYKYVPPTLVERPKMGFGVPLAEWLRGPLRGWAEALLLEDVGLIPSVLDPGAVRRMWDEHTSGRVDHKGSLWAVLMLQSWAVERGLRM